MRRHLTPVDISNNPELIRLVEEVEITKKPRQLKRDSKTVAILLPVGKTDKTKRNKPTREAAYEAFLSAAGGWKDIDTDKLIADIYASRRRSNRPPVKL